MSTSAHGSLTVAARLARREVRRHPWRHLLVALLILVPVLAALVCFSGIVTWQDAAHRQDTFRNPPAGAYKIDGGDAADAEVVDGSAASVKRLGLPEGTRVETSWNGADWLITDHQRPDGAGPQLAGAQMIEASAGTVGADRFVVTKGRLPLTDGEILLTKPVADAGGWMVGDRVETARSGRTFDVVGIGAIGDSTNRPAAAVTRQPLSYWQQPIVGFESVYVGDQWTNGRAEQQVTAWPPAGNLPAGFQPENGFYIPESSDQLDDRVRPGLLMASVAICAVVAVVASAAFAISSRRQLRSVGLLATVGADPATIRWAMVLQGAIPGLAAGIAAVAIGATAVVVGNANNALERIADISGAHLILSIGGAAIAVGLGLASGIAAAWQPARTVSRIPILSALAGRRPLRPIRTQVPVTGALLWLAGAVMLAIAFGGRAGMADTVQPYLIIGGIAALALGGVGLAPVLVAGLNPLAQRVRGTSRMGLRGLVRHRTQSAATVAAVAVALALPVGLLTSRNAVEPARPTSSYTYSDGSGTSAVEPPTSLFRTDPDVAAVQIDGGVQTEAATDATTAVAEVMGPSASIMRSIPMADESGEWRDIATIDEKVASSILVPWAATAIEQGKAIAIDGGPDRVTFRADGKQATFDAVGPPDGTTTWLPANGAAYLVGAGSLGDVGAERPDESRTVVRERPLSDRERTQINRLSGHQSGGLVTDPTLAAVRDAISPSTIGPSVSFAESGVDIIDVGTQAGDRGIEAVSPSTGSLRAVDQVLVAATAVALTLALLVLTITLSLRSVDSEAEQRAAFAAGVSPVRLRRQRAFEGVALALLGGLLALPLGWIPVAAAEFGAGSSTRYSVIDGIRQHGWLSTPGWLVIPILLAPAVLAGVLWTVLPWIRATVRSARHHGPVDLILSQG